MVMPAATADLCPQCGADVRTSGTRCKSCGFWLPAAPAPRTGPPMARPTPPRDDSGRTTIAVLVVGGFVVLGLVAAGAMVWLRQPARANAAPSAAAAVAAPAASALPVHLEPSNLLAEARREASAWHHEAVLVSLNASPLDGRGVATGGKVEISYAKPSRQRITGGAEAGSERLTLSTSGGPLTKNEGRSGKARVAPEPNCLFEDAWAAARRAGADENAGLGIRYLWNEKYGRPVWEVLNGDGQVQRRLDGVSCSILTR
jgi:hypothetical protein